jgi:hypothetical protein
MNPGLRPLKSCNRLLLNLLNSPIAVPLHQRPRRGETFGTSDVVTLEP